MSVFNLQEYIKYRVELGRELLNSEVDNNFKMVANPWVASRIYEEGNIVYAEVEVSSGVYALAWFRANSRTTKGIFNPTQWDLIGGIGEGGGGGSSIVNVEVNKGSGTEVSTSGTPYFKQYEVSVKLDSGQSYLIFVDGKLSFDSTALNNTLSYTNLDPVPTTIGGISAGQTFDQVTMQDLWTQLLYPYLNPSFASFSVSGGNPLEVGQALPAALTFSWSSLQSSNVQPGSIKIFDTTGDLITGQNASGTQGYTYGTAVQRNTYGTYTWNIQGLNTNGGTFNTSTAKAWYFRVFFGTSSFDGAPNEALIEGLANTPLLSGRSGNYTFAANNYKYIALPASYGIPNSILFNGLNLALADTGSYTNISPNGLTYAQISITNSYSITETYNVFRSKSPIVGDITVVVN